jgi:hypothetical protein
MDNELTGGAKFDQRIYYVIAFFIIAIALIAIYGQAKKNQLDSSFVIVNGATVNSFSATGRIGSGYFLDYSFQLQSKIYSGSTAERNIINSGGSTFVGKFFPVMYSSKNPSNSKLMVTPKDFEDYHYEYPDSLKWMLQYLRQ